jgi:type IV pilus assembly protein PilA
VSQFTFGIGYIMAALTQRRQALHDIIAGTLVVKATVTSEEVVQNPEAPAGSNGAAAVVVVAVVGFAMIAVIGILAAIAIPAYQNYTIRAQVAHALTLADQHKAAVGAALARGIEPASLNGGPTGTVAQELPVSGPYEDSINVVRGNVLITFGKSAKLRIQGKKLLLYHLIDQQGDVLWVCGTAIAPQEVDLDRFSQMRAVTDVPTQYLPKSCHS